MSDKGVLALCKGSKYCPEGGGCDLVKLSVGSQISQQATCTVLRRMRNLKSFDGIWVAGAVKLIASQNKNKPQFLLEYFTASCVGHRKNYVRNLFPTKEALLGCVEALPHLKAVQWIDICDIKEDEDADDHPLEAMCALTGLRELIVLHGIFITISKIRPILAANGQTLIELCLSYLWLENITEIGTLCPNLETLNLGGCGIMAETLDERMEPLFKKLKHLVLSSGILEKSAIQSTSFAKILCQAPLLQKIEFGESCVLDNREDFMSELAKGPAPPLEDLQFDDCEFECEDICAFLWPNNCLEKLTFTKNHVVDAVEALKDVIIARNLDIAVQSH